MLRAEMIHLKDKFFGRFKDAVV